MYVELIYTEYLLHAQNLMLIDECIQNIMKHKAVFPCTV